MATSKEIKEEYTSSLADLNFNSKPLISVLTMLAEENSQHAKDIVEAIETHLAKVRTEVKLPVLYLIDCIIKNVGGPYMTLFCQNIVPTFCSVFESVDERTRAEMFKLRQTWNDVLPPKKLYALDVQISMLDPAWPVTAPPPNNSIHLNPKFLMNSSKSKGSTIKKETSDSSAKSLPLTTPIIPVSSSTGALDPETLDMQQKLINKQKQLLELQQKKLELELLQTQVKLQEQLKIANVAGKMPSATTAQNLLLKPEVAKQLVTKPTARPNSVLMTGVKPKTTPMQTSSSFGQRMQTSGGPKIAPVSSALVAAARPIRDPRLLRQHQKQTNIVNSNVQLESKPQIDSNNKIVNSKMSVRENRTEPRSVSNKDISDKPKPPRTYPKSRTKVESSKTSRASKSSDSDSKTGSTSSLDSPSKSKGDSKPSSPVKSPSKHKKRDGAEKKVKSPTKSVKSNSSSPTSFKDVKISTKNRNYMRRNRKMSVSPEPEHGDVDLRMVPPEKQPRLQADQGEDKNSPSKAITSQGMDVDLRQLPNPITKKRTSTEELEMTNPKKTKTGMFDVLFGHEDTDLRQLPVVLSPPAAPTIHTSDRPPTPPPPIISSQDKSAPQEIKDSPKKPSLDALRAKLANATIKNKLNLSVNKKDTDLREFPPQISPSKRKNQIIISPADEQCIKMGNMTKEQEKALMNKIIAQIETQKLREAQRKESENLGNISLQPISDEEFDGHSSGDEVEEVPIKPQSFGDKDERVPPVHVNAPEEPYPKFVRQEHRDPRRPIMNWRGRRRHFENMYPVHPGMRPRIDQWARPMNSGPWRPMGPVQNYPRSHFVPPIDDNAVGGNSPNSEQTNDLIVDSPQDNHKTINIDGVARDIRYYDNQAIIFLNWDDPREISFQNGTRRVIFDDKEVFTLNFNDPYKEVTINGQMHKICFGGPTREFLVDGKYYECIFGGPAVPVDLAGKISMIKLEGPPPQVKIGMEKRRDIVCGKINLIIDAKTIVPVFLDASTQKFEILGKTHTLRFVDSLQTVLIDDVPHNVEFGGLPKPMMVGDMKHFVRFSVLPRGIKPGHVRIKDMEVTGSFGSPVHDENSQEGQAHVDVDLTEPALPVFSKRRRVVTGEESPDRNSNSPHMFQNIMQQQNLNNLDVLSSVMSSAMASAGNEGGYQVENVPVTETPAVTQPSLPANVALASAPPSLNINELFQKLVATGIVTTLAADKPAAPVVAPQTKQPVKNPMLNIRAVSFQYPETLKKRQSPLFEMLYKGMQCSSCGQRFPPEQSLLYSQHLDWHFRQNRKGKKNIRKAASRNWYYPISDWKNYEEIEDLEEQEKNYFDQQQSQTEGGADERDEEIEIPTIPADPDVQDALCEICQDPLELFYNEEKEEWQLRMAIRVDNKTYHPLCYEDYQASLSVPIDISAADVKELEKLEEKEKHIPGLEIVLDDDDEDESKKTAESVIIESEDSKLSQEELPKIDQPEENGKEKMEEDYYDEEEDDDVIIHEVIPEKIVLDDDDGDEDHVGLIPGVVVKEEPVDDGFMDVTGAVVKVKHGGEIKTEPNDLAENVELDTSLTTESSKPAVDTTHAEMVSSIDGNVELDAGSVPNISGKIKINISKPLPVPQYKETREILCEPELSSETFIDPSQPLPPGEEPIQLNVKPALRGLDLKKLPPVKKGSELTGLCSIM